MQKKDEYTADGMYKKGVDPEATCWHCKKTFLCDCMDATCRLCGAPYDKSRCKEFNFKPKKKITRAKLQEALMNATGCGIQHDGWPCGTCFFNFSDVDFTNEDWQALLFFRGDYEKKELENLPSDIETRIEKIYNACKNKKGALIPCSTES